MRRNLLLTLACAFVLSAAAQPTWRFHLAFEDGTGARDTIWLVYDTAATIPYSHWPVPMDEYDSTQSSIHYSDGGFHVFLINSLHDTTNSLAFPYSLFPQFETGNHIDAINWSPPMTITWDTSLFHAPYLPYNQGHFGMAIMDGIAFSQFPHGMGFGVFNMLAEDSVTIDFLWDYLFPFPVYFGPTDDTGIEIGSAYGPVQVRPNPATDKIWIQMRADRMEKMFIADAMGRVVLRRTTLTATDPLDISSLPPGRYFIHVLTAQNHHHHGTFEKVR